MTQKKSKGSEKIAKAHRSPCPIAKGLDIFGDRWSLLVMRDILFFEMKRFGDFLESPEGIPTNILADRLKRLETAEMIERRLYSQHPPRYEYFPTTKGHAMKPVLKSIVDWGKQHLAS